MELPNLKELNKIINLCRKTGVKVFELGELRITLTDAEPSKRTRVTHSTVQKGSIQANSVPDSMPSDEELLYMSAGGPPDLSGFPQ